MPFAAAHKWDIKLIMPTGGSPSFWVPAAVRTAVGSTVVPGAFYVGAHGAVLPFAAAHSWSSAAH